TQIFAQTTGNVTTSPSQVASLRYKRSTSEPSNPQTGTVKSKLRRFREFGRPRRKKKIKKISGMTAPPVIEARITKNEPCCAYNRPVDSTPKMRRDLSNERSAMQA